MIKDVPFEAYNASYLSSRNGVPDICGSPCEIKNLVLDKWLKVELRNVIIKHIHVSIFFNQKMRDVNLFKRIPAPKLEGERKSITKDETRAPYTPLRIDKLVVKRVLWWTRDKYRPEHPRDDVIKPSKVK